MNEEYQVKDDGERWHYYSQIPNIIDDANLSTSAFRLYCHLKRVAGAYDDGYCSQSIDTISEECGLSNPTVLKAESELVDAGLIVIEKMKSTHGEFSRNMITLVNLWPINEELYKRIKDKTLDPDVFCSKFFNQTNNNHAIFLNGSYLNLLNRTVKGICIAACKKIALKNNSLENKKSKNNSYATEIVAPEVEKNPGTPQEKKIGGRKVNNPSQPSLINTEPITKPPSNHNLMVSILARLCMMDIKLSASRIGATSSKLLKAGYIPDDLETFERWWKEKDFRGVKGEHPTLAIIEAKIYQAKQESPATVATKKKVRQIEHRGENGELLLETVEVE